MFEGVWSWLFSPAASVFVAVVVAILLVRRGYHRDGNGKLSRRKMASIFIVSASTYTFFVISGAQLILGGHSASEIIASGFGDERIAWLLLGVTTDGFYRIWSDFSNE